MNRRNFGRMLMGAAATLGGSTLSGPVASAQQRAAVSDVPWRVLPDLKVRRLGDIHTGGDYHTLVGKGPTDPRSLDFFRRFNARYLTVRANTTASAEEMKQWPHAGVFLNADGPWNGDELMRWQDDCRAADCKPALREAISRCAPARLAVSLFGRTVPA